MEICCIRVQQIWVVFRMTNERDTENSWLLCQCVVALTGAGVKRQIGRRRPEKSPAAGAEMSSSMSFLMICATVSPCVLGEKREKKKTFLKPPHQQGTIK